MFSLNTDSLGCQYFKGTSRALVLGMPLRDTIKSLLLVLDLFLTSTFGLVSWICAHIISNLIKYNFSGSRIFFQTCLVSVTVVSSSSY